MVFASGFPADGAKRKDGDFRVNSLFRPSQPQSGLFEVGATFPMPEIAIALIVGFALGYAVSGWDSRRRQRRSF